MSEQGPADERAEIVWFRDDLRLADHAPLTRALASGRRVAACYVLDADRGAALLGGARRWWLHGSLWSLERSLAQRGGELLLARGDPPAEVARLAAELKAAKVHCHRSYEPLGRRHETELARALAATGAELVTHPGAVLFEPQAVTTRDGGPFRMFGPFSRACLDASSPEAPLPEPAGRLFRAWHAAHPASRVRLDDLGLRPREPDWTAGLAARWTPGEPDAHRRLDRFVAHGLADYAAARDRIDRETTSRLSPHLKSGEISVRSLWHRVRAYAAVHPEASQGAAGFVRELLWREFAMHSLWHSPTLPDEPLDGAFAALAWRDDRAELRAWRRGATGYPIVDAGMRELWQTGWLHNRTRMIVASFVVKDLLCAWQRGAAWFLDTLVDADLASNSLNWQWVAGSGPDAAPFFRIFNPTLQGRKFDPDAVYVKRFVPELAKVPARHAHSPAAASAAELAAVGVELGKTYPRPIVDHRAARLRSLEAYRGVRQARSR